MANNNVTTPVEALSTATPQTQRPHRGVPRDGGGTARRDGECFTTMELAAAKQLVMLSESSSADSALQAASRSSSAASSSSVPSVSNLRPPTPPGETMADEREEDEEEGISTGPSVRRRRYRSIRSLYEATSPIDGASKRRSAAQRGRKDRM